MKLLAAVSPSSPLQVHFPFLPPVIIITICTHYHQQQGVLPESADAAEKADNENDASGDEQQNHRTKEDCLEKHGACIFLRRRPAAGSDQQNPDQLQEKKIATVTMFPSQV